MLPLLTFTAIVFEVALAALLTTHHISMWCCSFMGNNDDCCQKFSNVKKVHSCWTGYYSSFPALKYALRKLDTSLRHAEMLSVLATATDASAGSGEEWEAALGWGRHTQGILQHHGECLQTGRRVCSQSWLTRQDKTRMRSWPQTLDWTGIPKRGQSSLLGEGLDLQCISIVYKAIHLSKKGPWWKSGSDTDEKVAQGVKQVMTTPKRRRKLSRYGSLDSDK